MVELILGNQIVKIDAGELVSYQVDGYEVIHQKGSPGWRNSDTEMFPIIGPTNEACFKVETPKGSATQDQHGLLREMVYGRMEVTSTMATFKKEYFPGKVVKNSKYPSKSNVEFLSWPYNFSFFKVFKLSDTGLEIKFIISGDKGMPYMLGYHPAFKLHSNAPEINANNTKVTLPEVIKAGSRALPILDCDTITLVDEKKVEIKTQGFSNFMLWTEVSNMLCVEPISFYPYAVSQDDLHNGFKTQEAKEDTFKVTIKVF